MNLIENLKKENNFLAANLQKIVKELEDRDIVKIQKTEDHNLYFYLSAENKVEVVAKVPKGDVIEQKFKESLHNAAYQDHK